MVRFPSHSILLFRRAGARGRHHPTSTAGTAASFKTLTTRSTQRPVARRLPLGCYGGDRIYSPVARQVRPFTIPANQQHRLVSVKDPTIPNFGIMNTNDDQDTNAMHDIEELHRHAVQCDQETYIDPNTGLTVFTAIAHRERGYCCGSKCRHCPYRTWTTSTATPSRAVTTTTTTSRNSTIIDTATTPTGATPYVKTRKKNVPYTRTGDHGTSQLMTGERRNKSDDIFHALGTVDELCAVVGVAHALIVQQHIQSSTPHSNEAQDTTNNNEPVTTGQIAIHVVEDYLLQIMSRLFDVGSHLAKPKRRCNRRRQHDTQDDDDDTSDSDDDSINGSSEDDEGFVADGIGGGLDVQHIDDLEHWIDALTEELPELRNFILPSGTVLSAQLHVARCVCRRSERSVVPLVQNNMTDPNVLKYLNRLSDFFFVVARWCNLSQGGTEFVYKKPSRDSTQRVATTTTSTAHSSK